MSKRPKYKPVTPCTLLQVIGEDKKEYRSEVFKHEDIKEIIVRGGELAKQLTSPKYMVIINALTNKRIYRYDKDA